MRVRLLHKPKPDNYTESCGIDAAGRWRERNVWYPGRSARNALKGVTITIYVRVHPKSMKKFKDRLREYSSRRRCQSIKPSLEKIKVYVRGWMNYYGIASMKYPINELNGWLYRRIRMCIWKQWKLPRTRKRKLVGLGVDEHYAATIAYSRKAFKIQYGEGPYPIKPSRQSVPRLGIEAVRSDLSVVRGAREPQCESVK